MKQIIVPAAESDLGAVLLLLQQVSLPVAGVADEFPGDYCVARLNDEVVGVAGLESYGEFGLLRSVAVHSSRRGSGLGRLLVEDRLVAARARELTSVYLLTTTAAAYFAVFGFKIASRGAAPENIRASLEFQSICPASAVCLVRDLRANE
ncbi:MAG TPA: arsenic resistance N-acetyltransferase ArsN2 [Polyangiaceae bacterium]|nr:arsenic resistance N-acetyltransferase ArsN2 [Polyangiaceae bacterium]